MRALPGGTAFRMAGGIKKTPQPGDANMTAGILPKDLERRVHMKYTTERKEEQGQILYYKPYPTEMRRQLSPLSIALRIILVVVLIAATIIFACRAEDVYAKGWILCKDYVLIRIAPSRGAQECGQLDPGDEIEIDGETADGFAHIVSPCDGWVWAGNITFAQVEKIDDVMTVVAKKQVACRRWIDGPQIDGNKWAKNGTEVKVFYMSEEWAVTSRGYIKSEWLEV